MMTLDPVRFMGSRSRLWQARKRARKSLEKAAAVIDHDPRLLYLCEQGWCWIDLDKARALAEFYGCPLAFFYLPELKRWQRLLPWFKWY